MQNIYIRYFGFFRQFGDGIDICCPCEASVNDLKDILCEKLGPDNAAVIRDSVIADTQTILSETQRLENKKQLLLLPPVCGG